MQALCHGRKGFSAQRIPGVIQQQHTRPPARLAHTPGLAPLLHSITVCAGMLAKAPAKSVLLSNTIPLGLAGDLNVIQVALEVESEGCWKGSKTHAFQVFLAHKACGSRQ